MEINTEVPSNIVSKELLDLIVSMDARPFHYNSELWLDSINPEVLSSITDVLATYDFEASMFRQTQKHYQAAVQNMLDSEAQAAGYDNIISASSYAGYTNPYQLEAQALLTRRANVWQYVEAQLAEVVAGNRTLPTIEELILELETL